MPVQRLRVESVAGLDGAGFQARGEPAHALRAGAVGEAVGHDVALRAFLQRIVTDFGGGVHGFFDVALFQDFALVFCMVRPNAGKAIGLQLYPHL